MSDVLTEMFRFILVMVEVPAVGKAGNYLDWIARGLEMNVVKRFWLNPCPIKTGARLLVL